MYNIIWSMYKTGVRFDFKISPSLTPKRHVHAQNIYNPTIYQRIKKKLGKDTSTNSLTHSSFYTALRYVPLSYSLRIPKLLTSIC